MTLHQRQRTTFLVRSANVAPVTLRLLLPPDSPVTFDNGSRALHLPAVSAGQREARVRAAWSLRCNGPLPDSVELTIEASHLGETATASETHTIRLAEAPRTSMQFARATLGIAAAAAAAGAAMVLLRRTQPVELEELEAIDAIIVAAEDDEPREVPEPPKPRRATSRKAAKKSPAKKSSTKKSSTKKQSSTKSASKKSSSKKTTKKSPPRSR